MIVLLKYICSLFLFKTKHFISSYSTQRLVGWYAFVLITGKHKQKVGKHFDVNVAVLMWKHKSIQPNVRYKHLLKCEKWCESGYGCKSLDVKTWIWTFSSDVNSEYECQSLDVKLWIWTVKVLMWITQFEHKQP